MSFFNTTKHKVTNTITGDTIEVKVLARTENYNLAGNYNSRQDLDQIALNSLGTYDDVWNLCNANAGELSERLFNIELMSNYRIPQ